MCRLFRRRAEDHPSATAAAAAAAEAQTFCVAVIVGADVECNDGVVLFNGEDEQRTRTNKRRTNAGCGFFLHIARVFWFTYSVAQRIMYIVLDNAS